MANRTTSVTLVCLETRAEVHISDDAGQRIILTCAEAVELAEILVMAAHTAQRGDAPGVARLH